MEKTNEANKETNMVEKQVKVRRKERTYSKYPLPSNRHGFQVHFDILRRFVTQGRSGGVAAQQVEGEGIPVQAASMNVRFLRSIGLLGPSGRGLYVPTQEAILFINAKSVSDEKARPVLASLLSKTWFAELAQSAFSTQPIMSEDQFLGELALAAQTDRVREHLALSTLLEYIVYAGIVVKDERGLSLGSLVKPMTSGDSMSIEASQIVQPPINQRVSMPERTPSETPGWHVLQTEDFHVRVKSDLDVVDDLIAHLETIKRKITRLKGGNG